MPFSFTSPRALRVTWRGDVAAVQAKPFSYNLLVLQVGNDRQYDVSSLLSGAQNAAKHILTALPCAPSYEAFNRFWCVCRTSGTDVDIS